MTTRLSPIDAPHTEIVSRIIGIGVWVIVIVVVVNIISSVNSVSIIASIHIRVSIKCLYCVARPSIIMKKIVDRVILISSISRAYI